MAAMKKPVSRLALWGFILCGFLSAGFTTISLSDIEGAILNQDYSQAQHLAQKFLSQQPQESQYHEAQYYLGISYLWQKEYKKARDTFNDLLSHNASETIKIKSNLGVIDSYYMNGQYESALHNCLKLIKTASHSEFASLIYLKTARANLKLTHWGNARRYLKKIVNDYPQSLEAPIARQLLEEKQYFAVQLGAFLEQERAQNLVKDLNANGYYAYIVETVDPKDRLFYRVRIGKVTSLKEAQDLKETISKLGYPTRIYP